MPHRIYLQARKVLDVLLTGQQISAQLTHNVSFRHQIPWMQIFVTQSFEGVLAEDYKKS